MPKWHTLALQLQRCCWWQRRRWFTVHFGLLPSIYGCSQYGCNRPTDCVHWDYVCQWLSAQLPVPISLITPQLARSTRGETKVKLPVKVGCCCVWGFPSLGIFQLFLLLGKTLTNQKLTKESKKGNCERSQIIKNNKKNLVQREEEVLLHIGNEQASARQCVTKRADW